MLRVENLSIRRGGKTVLEGLELELRPGEMLGVLGPNGAGKSTLLGALCGELEPAEGLVLLDERGLDDWPGVARAQRLAVLPQSSSLGCCRMVARTCSVRPRKSCAPSRCARCSASRSWSSVIPSEVIR